MLKLAFLLILTCEDTYLYNKMNSQFNIFERRSALIFILTLLMAFYSAHAKAATLPDESEQIATFNADAIPSFIDFERSAYIAHEGESIVINIARQSGTDEISVDYITVDDTALADVDYTHTAGTLNWVAGEMGVKTVTIPILINPSADGNKTVRLELSAQNENVLFSFKTVPLTIIDNELVDPQLATLSVSVAGTGEGMISAVGLSCGVRGDDCEEDYTIDSSLIITPTPPIEGSTFVEWLGDCDAFGRVDMTGNKFCTAVFSSDSNITMNVTQTTVSEGETAITGELIRTGSLTGSALVNLSSSDTSEIIVAEFVVIPDGADSVNFAINVVDDSDFDGTQTVTLSASLDNEEIGTAELDVLDNESNLKLTVKPLVFSESVGSIIGTVNRIGANGEVTVNLSSSDISEITVPQTVLLSDGESSAEFEITVLNDSEADGTQFVELTANQPDQGFTSIELQVLDNEVLVLKVEPSRFSENIENQPLGTIIRAGELDVENEIEINLLNSDPSEITVPETVIIPAGQKMARFTISAVKDEEVDGSQFVTLTVNHPDYMQGEIEVEVADTECHLDTFDLSLDRIPSFDRSTVAELESDAFCAFNEDVIEELSAESFEGLNADQLNKIQCEGLSSLEPEQFRYIPKTALSGLTPRTLGCFSSEVIFEIGLNDLQSLNVDGSSSDELGRILNNMNTDEISAEDILNLLPDGWKIDRETNVLTAPPGAKLGFKALQRPDDLTPQIELPELPNLNTGFGLGGWSRSGENALDELNKSLSQAKTDNADILKFFTFSQDEKTGIVTVIGSGEFEGVHLSLIPDVDNMIQVDADVPVGLSIANNGQFIMTTPNGYQFPLIPAPQIEEVLAVSQAGRLELGSKGDTLAIIPSDTGETFATVIFDSFVKPAPEGVNAGVHFSNENSVKSTRSEDDEVLVVYEDGTAQAVHPTVYLPEIFIEEAYKFPGVEKVTFNTDGTFTVIFAGQALIIEPSFLVFDEDVPDDETTDPGISLNESGGINYVIGYKVPKESSKASRRSRRKKLTYPLPIRCVNGVGLECLNKQR